MLASCNKRMADAAAHLILLALVILLCSRLCLDICCCCGKQASLLAPLQSGPGHMGAAVTHQHSRICRAGMAASLQQAWLAPRLTCVRLSCLQLCVGAAVCLQARLVFEAHAVHAAGACRRIKLDGCVVRPLAPDTRRLPGVSGTVLMAPWAAHRALQCLLVHVTCEPKVLSLALLQAPGRVRPGKQMTCTEVIDQVDFGKSSHLFLGLAFEFATQQCAGKQFQTSESPGQTFDQFDGHRPPTAIRDVLRSNTQPCARFLVVITHEMLARVGWPRRVHISWRWVTSRQRHRRAFTLLEPMQHWRRSLLVSGQPTDCYGLDASGDSLKSCRHMCRPDITGL